MQEQLCVAPMGANDEDHARVQRFGPAHPVVLNLVSVPDVTNLRMGRLMANPHRSDP